MRSGLKTPYGLCDEIARSVYVAPHSKGCIGLLQRALRSVENSGLNTSSSTSEGVRARCTVDTFSDEYWLP